MEDVGDVDLEAQAVTMEDLEPQAVTQLQQAAAVGLDPVLERNADEGQPDDTVHGGTWHARQGQKVHPLSPGDRASEPRPSAVAK